MTRSWLWLAVLTIGSVGCSQSPVLRGKIAGLQNIVEQAERNGAIRCAPRELAVAKSQLEFAALELDQGFVSKAQGHLWRAEPNAHAACRTRTTLIRAHHWGRSSAFSTPSRTRSCTGA